MSVLQAIILGLVQGLTEFLPISSSGHLILVPWLFNWHFLLANPDLNKTFDVALHLGTLLAVLAYFWRDVVRLLGAWGASIARRRPMSDPDAKLAWLLLIATVPAGVVGVAFESFIEDRLGKPIIIALVMMGFALVMWVIDRRVYAQRPLDSMKPQGALLVGCAQALALCPGVSRSGVTMMGGMLLRLSRENAARFSFLLTIPVIGGAAAYKAIKVAHSGLPAGTKMPFLVGTLTAAVSGFVAVWFLINYLKRHDFRPFIFYRLAAGIAVIVIIVSGLRSATGI
jgi:undecaprenyl-diphosphatase